MASSYRFVVTGQVQGVFFRKGAVEQARTLALAGWVRNREDGAVEGIACGAPEALDRFRDWLARGPPAAQVKNVEWLAGAAEPPGGQFTIER